MCIRDSLGALLLFDPDNVRYVTSTKLGEWVNNKLNRYTLLAEGHDPILFEIGSAIGTKKMLCPWIKDIRPSKNDMRGSMTPLLKASEKVIGEVYEILKGWNLDKAPIGVDILTVPMMQAFMKFGFDVRDGQATMQESQKIKTYEAVSYTHLDVYKRQHDIWLYRRIWSRRRSS